MADLFDSKNSAFHLSADDMCKLHAIKDYMQEVNPQLKLTDKGVVNTLVAQTGAISFAEAVETTFTSMVNKHLIKNQVCR